MQETSTTDRNSNADDHQAHKYETCMMHSTERAKLESYYKKTLIEKLEYRQLVTYALNKKQPVYNWFKFKESFSKQLVELVLQEWDVPKGDIVLDPFAGCGTTLLASKDLGYSAIGTDVLPISVFVSRAKLCDSYDLHRVRAAIDEIGQAVPIDSLSRYPNVPIVDKAIDDDAQKDLLFYRDKIRRFESPTRDLFLLALVSIIEEVSHASKDGQFLRLVKKDIPPVRTALLRKLKQMHDDLIVCKTSISATSVGKAEILLGDARDLSLPKDFVGHIGVVITSPPYLNRYDYSRTYVLELCTLFVDDCEELKRIRHSLLRSHIESREADNKALEIPALDEIMTCLEASDLNNKRIPIMVEGYFEDMNRVIKNLHRVMKSGGIVALVVANARFSGEMVPVDLILSEIAANHGFKTEEIWITRYKGNSSQQMGKYGRRPVRESILFWRKP